MKPLFQEITLKENVSFRGCVVGETDTHLKVVVSGDLTAFDLELAYDSYGPLDEGIVFGLCSRNVDYDACDGATFFSISKESVIDRKDCKDTKDNFEEVCGFYGPDGCLDQEYSRGEYYGDALKTIEAAGVEIGDNFNRSSEDGYTFELQHLRDSDSEDDSEY